MKYYCQDKDTVLHEMSSRERGLTEAEASERLAKNGKNILEKAKGKSLLRRFVDQLLDPMSLVLIGAAVVSGILAVVQNESFSDVIIILVVVIVNAMLGVYQESKAEAALLGFLIIPCVELMKWIRRRH